VSTPSAAREEQEQSAPYLVSIKQDQEKTETTPVRPAALDMVVFGVTAVIAIGFVIWSFVSTARLACVSDDALSGIMEYLGWWSVSVSPW